MKFTASAVVNYMTMLFFVMLISITEFTCVPTGDLTITFPGFYSDIQIESPTHAETNGSLNQKKTQKLVQLELPGGLCDCKW